MKYTLIIAFFMSTRVFAQVEPPKVESPPMEKPQSMVSLYPDVYVEAQFPGGAISLKRYLSNYDKEMTKGWSDSSFNKRGYINFTIEVDGSTSEITMLRTISPEADSLAKELISNMPKWEPAENHTGAVRSRFRLPIIFSKKE